MGFSGCKGAEPKAEVPEALDAKAEMPEKAEPPKKEAAPQVYTLEAPDLAVKVGEKGDLTINVKPVAGYKINEQYPWKVEVAVPENLGVASTKMGKDKWSLGKDLASVVVPVEAKGAGDGVVTAKLKFSICNEDKCELLKKDVTVKVAAK
jgi:hypothetical protein